MKFKKFKRIFANQIFKHSIRTSFKKEEQNNYKRLINKHSLFLKQTKIQVSKKLGKQSKTTLLIPLKRTKTTQIKKT